MKKTIVLLSCLVNSMSSFAQNQEPCYFDDYKKMHRKWIAEAENEIQQALGKENFKSSRSHSAKVIPVVVHVIHIGGTENISDTQIQSQIDVLNEDFRKVSGTNGDGNGVDTEIEFCLAKITPDGKCTDGIVRIESSLSNHKTHERGQLKDLSYWDNTRYLNLYIVKTINNGNGVLGYSSFPGGPPDEDGIVVLHNAFGDTGTVSQSSTYNLGRTTTHEIGHWFGLYHTFNNGCGTDTCSDGDYVCDTPPAANPNFGCPTSTNSCSNDIPNIIDQVQNYTDYSNDACKNMFTDGQKQRMETTLSTFRSNIWQPANITATGCDSGYVSPQCNVIADFTSNGQNICIGNSVNFINKSLNNPLTYQWDFPGGTPSSALTANVAVTYNTAGTYPVKLITTNALGTDSVIIANCINVTTPTIGQSLPFIEGFENSTFPPNGINISNPDNGITWERDTMAVPYSGIASAKINNLINTNYGQSDALVLPVFNLSGYSYTPYLKFKWAYARSDANYSDELVVLLSKDCGVSFTQILYKSGSSLVTGPTQTTPYITDSNTVWKAANVSLNNYASYSNVLIKIVNVTDGGNNLYIDDISVGEITIGVRDNERLENSIQIYPNPFTNQAQINYQLNSKEQVSIAIYDIMGREVQVLQKGEQQAGDYILPVNAEKLNGSSVYIVRFKIGNNIYVKKLVFNQ